MFFVIVILENNIKLVLFIILDSLYKIFKKYLLVKFSIYFTINVNKISIILDKLFLYYYTSAIIFYC